MSWNKGERVAELEEEINKGEVDEDILPLVNMINSNPDYFTTSSCAGRITLIEMPELGEKTSAEFLGKWHREVEVDEVKAAFSDAGQDTLVFLLAQSPILHVRCRTLRSAVRLRNIAVESGLKYSTIRSLTLDSIDNPSKIVVEILSSENIHVPVAKRGELYPNDDYLSFLVENANQAFRRSRKRLERFMEGLRSELLKAIGLKQNQDTE